ncbi:MAG: histone deacetylase family protein [Elusimicrobiota bacterium]
MKIIYSEKCAEYNAPYHPESPARVLGTKKFLDTKGFEFVIPKPATETDIMAVHTKKLLEMVRKEDFIDADTPALPGIFNYALLSAGAAIEAANFSKSGEFAFSMMRPPGHHAGKNFLGGFCYFNNIAIATKYLIAQSPNPRLKSGATIAILDIDCHHGNGTQDIFLGDANVVYISLHQVPLYPGTGLKSEKNCLNFPLSPGTDETRYLEILDIALTEIKKVEPDIIGISVGFDTYENDPLTQLNLKKESYTKIAQKIAGLHLKTFAVLEGGYSPEMPECVFNFLAGFETL